MFRKVYILKLEERYQKSQRFLKTFLKAPMQSLKLYAIIHISIYVYQNNISFMKIIHLKIIQQNTVSEILKDKCEIVFNLNFLELWTADRDSIESICQSGNSWDPCQTDCVQKQLRYKIRRISYHIVFIMLTQIQKLCSQGLNTFMGISAVLINRLFYQLMNFSPGD